MRTTQNGITIENPVWFRVTFTRGELSIAATFNQKSFNINDKIVFEEELVSVSFNVEYVSGGYVTNWS